MLSIWSIVSHWFNSPLLYWLCKILVHLFYETLPAVISSIITKHSPTKLLQGLHAEEKGRIVSTLHTHDKIKLPDKERVCTWLMIGTKTLTHMLKGIAFKQCLLSTWHNLVEICRLGMRQVASAQYLIIFPEVSLFQYTLRSEEIAIYHHCQDALHYVESANLGIHYSFFDNLAEASSDSAQLLDQVMLASLQWSFLVDQG